jgi:[ribosomal protein S18]-alanine N-acetyltransferase
MAGRVTEVATRSRDAAPLLEVRIRSMDVTDVEEVTRLELASYAFPWSEGIFRDSLRVGYRCSVLELGVVIAGYGVLATGAGEAHLLNLCVREQFRFRGLGSRVLQHLLTQAREADARVMFLETRPSNQAAIRLYQSAGFAQIGTRKGYYQAVNGREDAIVMRRLLT